MTFIDLRESFLDELPMVEMHNVPELILTPTGADDVLPREVEKSVLANVIGFRHLAQIGKTNLSDGPQLAVHRHELLLHHGLPHGIMMTIKDGACHCLHSCSRQN